MFTWNKSGAILALALGAIAAPGLPAQQLSAGSDAASSVKIDLPADSPVTLISTSMGQSRVSARGGALVLDLHMSLTLRNSGARPVRGVTLLITAQEFTPGGKGSVARPCIDVPSGQNFTLPVDIRLVRPVQQSSGPLVNVQLDGVLFDDLSFYGPNKLNSKRAMTFWEVEAQRDRAYYKQILASRGQDGLRQEVLSSMARGAGRSDLEVALSRNGSAVGAVAANGANDGVNDKDRLRFAFLRMENAPVLAVQGQAAIAGNEARSPWIEVQNTSKKPVRYVEIGWVVKDKDGNEYLAGSVPGSGAADVIPAGQRGRLEPDVTLKFSHANRPLNIESMTGFVSKVEFTDGKVWVPSRSDFNAAPLLRAVSPSNEEQRLLDIYSHQGLAALVTELGKY